MLAWLGAVLIGLSLGLLGSGGSIITVPVLVYLAGEPGKIAIAESLGIVSVIAGVGALNHVRHRHVDWRSVWLAGLPAMLGSYAGAWVSQFISARMQLILFAIVMLIAGWRMYMNAMRTDWRPSYCRPGCLLALGLGVGILSGIVGVGGGFLIVPALILLGGLNMSMAVGSSLMIICLSSAIGFSKQLHLLYASGVHLNWNTFALFVVLGIIGSLAGPPIRSKLPQPQLQKIYAVAVVIMAGLILWKSAVQ
ncbi:MAG: sulfite exporter TauE/SafE family protein [Steroidobacter sp.]